MSAGGTITRDIEVKSGSSEPQTLLSYPVDGLTGTTTGVVFGNRTDDVREAGRWVTLSEDRFTLAPGATRRVRATIRVPQNASAGDHVGGIIFQPAGKPEASGGSFSVRQVVRVGLAAHVRVDGALRRGMEVGELGIKPVAGTQVPSIVVGLTNTGNVLCKPKLQVALTRDGQPAGTETRQLDTVLPGDEVPYPMPWPEPLESGTYDTGVTVTGCGPAVEQTAALTLADSLTGTPQNQGPREIPKPGGIPVWAIGLVAFFGLLGGFLLARRRPRREPQPQPQAPPSLT
ncbi:MAG: hypothetical protein JHC84_09685 [Solirubrobacteraceae bacterium]|nr:hypothetical protein [Solirubrobacteraceae bacterium]